MVNGVVFKSQNNTRLWIAVTPNPRVQMVEEIPGTLVRITHNDGATGVVSDTWQDVMNVLCLQVVPTAETVLQMQAPRPREPRLDGSRA